MTTEVPLERWTTEVRLGRWQDVLPGTYDPDRAIVVTDPPYGLQAENGMGVRSPGSHAGTGRPDGSTLVDMEKGYEDVIPWGEHVREVLELLPARRHLIRGPATILVRRDFPAPRRVCIEASTYRRREAHRPGVVPYLWQGWAVYGRLQLDRHTTRPLGDFMVSSITSGRDQRSYRPRTAHRAITPFSSALWIVDTWVDPGCVVLDPFAGTGTVGIAARTLGFDYIGAEVVPEYHRVAQEALAIERLTMGLDQWGDQ